MDKSTIKIDDADISKQLFQNIYIEIIKPKSICMDNGQQIKNYFLTGKSKSNANLL